MLAHRVPARSNIGGFGRRRPFVHAQTVAPTSTVGDDLKLFLVTFLGGLVFMTVYLA